MNKKVTISCVGITIITIIVAVLMITSSAHKNVPHVITYPWIDNIEESVYENYYELRDRQDGMKLYVSDKNNFFIQIPENSYVIEGKHIDDDTYADTCNISFDDCFIAIMYNYNTNHEKQFTTLEEVLNAYSDDGITLQGEIKDFEAFEIDDFNGYKFCQYVSERSQIEYIHYYTSNGQIGITAQYNNTELNGEILSQILSSILIK